jgi:hypothetical protein
MTLQLPAEQAKEMVAARNFGDRPLFGSDCAAYILVEAITRSSAPHAPG